MNRTYIFEKIEKNVVVYGIVSLSWNMIINN